MPGTLDPGQGQALASAPSTPWERLGITRETFEEGREAVSQGHRVSPGETASGQLSDTALTNTNPEAAAMVESIMSNPMNLSGLLGLQGMSGKAANAVGKAAGSQAMNLGVNALGLTGLVSTINPVLAAILALTPRILKLERENPTPTTEGISLKGLQGLALNQAMRDNLLSGRLAPRATDPAVPEPTDLGPPSNVPTPDENGPDANTDVSAPAAAPAGLGIATSIGMGLGDTDGGGTSGGNTSDAGSDTGGVGGVWHEGGRIGRDRNPRTRDRRITAQEGEYVVDADSTRAFSPLLEAINRAEPRGLPWERGSSPPAGRLGPDWKGYRMREGQNLTGDEQIQEVDPDTGLPFPAIEPEQRDRVGRNPQGLEKLLMLGSKR